MIWAYELQFFIEINKQKVLLNKQTIHRVILNKNSILFILNIL
jgi:hypothetical protein